MLCSHKAYFPPRFFKLNIPENDDKHLKNWAYMYICSFSVSKMLGGKQVNKDDSLRLIILIETQQNGTTFCTQIFNKIYTTQYCQIVTWEKVQSYHWKGKKNLGILLLTMLAIHLSLVEALLFHQLCFRHFQCKLLYREGAGQTCQCQLLGGDHSNPQCNRSAGSDGQGSSPWLEGDMPE